VGRKDQYKGLKARYKISFCMSVPPFEQRYKIGINKGLMFFYVVPSGRTVNGLHTKFSTSKDLLLTFLTYTW